MSTETYPYENELNKLNEQWNEAIAAKDYAKADQIQKYMDRLSEQSIALADMRLKASLKRCGML